MADVLAPPLCPEGFDGDALVDRCTEQLVEELMGIADQLLEQGRQRGLVEGRRLDLVKLLAKRFGSLPENVLARVTVAEEADLDRWLDRILTASTLAEVLE